MKKKIPLLSIIITTTGRIETLSQVIEYYLKTVSDDLEFIISDNSGSKKKISKIDSIKDIRFKKFKTTKKMDIEEHWNWVIKKATGKYLCFNCDDNILLDDALHKLREINKKKNIDIFTYAISTYFYPDWDLNKKGFPFKGNILSIPKYLSKKYYRFDPKNMIKFFCSNFRFPPSFPSCVSLIFSKEFYEKTSKNKKILLAPCPDVSLSVFLLYHTNKNNIVYWDGIGAIGGRSKTSNMTQVINNEKISFIEEFKDKNKFKYHPILVDSISNYLACAVSQLNKLFTKSKKEYKLNILVLLKKIIDDFFIEKNGLYYFSDQSNEYIKKLSNKYLTKKDRINFNEYYLKFIQNFNPNIKMKKLNVVSFKSKFILFFLKFFRNKKSLQIQSRFYCDDNQNLYINLDNFNITFLSKLNHNFFLKYIDCENESKNLIFMKKNCDVKEIKMK